MAEQVLRHVQALAGGEVHFGERLGRKRFENLALSLSSFRGPGGVPGRGPVVLVQQPLLHQIDGHHVQKPPLAPARAAPTRPDPKAHE